MKTDFIRFPQQICDICIEKLTISYNFKQQIEQTDKLLKTIEIRKMPFITKEEEQEIDCRDNVDHENEDECIVNILISDAFDEDTVNSIKTIDSNESSQRKKSISCGKCSLNFLNKKQLKQHIVKEHTCDKDTYVP